MMRLLCSHQYSHFQLMPDTQGHQSAPSWGSVTKRALGRLAKVPRGAVGQGLDLAEEASSAASATAACPKSPYPCDTSHHLVIQSNFQVKPHKTATEKTSHKPVVSSPVFLLSCKAQSELISHLALCQLFS